MTNQTIKAKNWAFFYIDLDNFRDKVREEKKTTIDPYKQWIAIEQLRICDRVLTEYSKYLKIVNNNELGTQFLTTLEEMVKEYAEHPRDEAYQPKNDLINKIYRDFQKFRVTY